MINPSLKDLQAERALISSRHHEAQVEVETLRGELKRQQDELSTLESAIESVHQELTVMPREPKIRGNET